MGAVLALKPILNPESCLPLKKTDRKHRHLSVFLTKLFWKVFHCQTDFLRMIQSSRYGSIFMRTDKSPIFFSSQQKPVLQFLIRTAFPFLHKSSVVTSFGQDIFNEGSQYMPMENIEISTEIKIKYSQFQGTVRLASYVTFICFLLSMQFFFFFF